MKPLDLMHLIPSSDPSSDDSDDLSDDSLSRGPSPKRRKHDSGRAISNPSPPPASFNSNNARVARRTYDYYTDVSSGDETSIPGARLEESSTNDNSEDGSEDGSEDDSEGSEDDSEDSEDTSKEATVEAVSAAGGANGLNGNGSGESLSSSPSPSARSLSTATDQANSRTQPSGDARHRDTRTAPSSRPRQGDGATGRLSDVEERALNEAIATFLEENELADDAVPSLVKGDLENTPDGKRFWARIYESVPTRASRHVRAIVKRKHTPYSAKKEWTREEDQRLVKLAKEHERQGDRWLRIGKILERTAPECRDRYRNYALCGEARAVGPWQDEDLGPFLEALRKFIPADGDGPLHEVPRIDWTQVSVAMHGRRSRQQCLAKWNKMHPDVNRPRVRRLLHGMHPGASPSLRIMLMQVHSTSEERLRRFVNAVATHVAEGEKPILWRQIEAGFWTKELRIETLNIIWSRLRKGFGGDMGNKSDQEVARKIVEAVEEGRSLEGELEAQEDVEIEEEILREPRKGLSTRASYRGGQDS